MAASVRTRVVSWKLAAEMKESVESEALVIPRRSGRPVAGFLPAELAVMAAAALVAAVTIALLSMGLAGPIELMAVLGNVLSYARLMAIGLAGVMLALIADAMGGLLPVVVLGVLVAVLLHGVNLILGIFDASVQSLRLHYVEFFTKFVEPGGLPYKPFTSVLGGAAAASTGTRGD